MESKKRERSRSSNETKIDDFAAEREIIEEKHRIEVLNLLRSFEFERKDNEARFVAAREQKDNEAKLIQHGEQQEGFSKDGDVIKKQKREADEVRKQFEKEKENLMSKIEELEAKLIQRREQQEDFPKDGDVNEKLENERDELRKTFEKEKENLMSKIEDLEKEVLSKRHVENEEGDEECQRVSPDIAMSEATADEQDTETPDVNDGHMHQTAEGPNGELHESEANATATPHTAMEKEEWLTEKQIPKLANNSLKSLTELEKENKDLKEDLDCQREEVNELGNQVAHFNQKLDNIREVFEDEDVLAADKNQRIHEILEDCSRKKNDSFDESTPNRCQISHPQRSNSEMSFQLEELNVENEELRNNVLEIERKFRRTVEEYEIQRSVFQEKINVVLERLIEAQQSDEGGHSSELSNGVCGDDLKNTINELRNVELEKSSVEFLEDYVGIILRWNSDSKSRDSSDVDLRREIQSLEQLLDIEIFDGRAFDDEMKDEVGQVLRDKERELMVARAVENLRTEIRHRVATECTLEELRKERENHFSIYHAARQILREHLGISGTAGDTEELEKGLEGYSQVQPVDAEEKLDEELTNSADVDALKEEKEELEQALRELQYRFEKEQQEWSKKLGSASQEEDAAEKDDHDNDKVIENLRAQIAAMEEVLNTERFNLSRLYYVEMKEELDASLKMYHAQHSGKQETARLTDAWKHHVEVGELYQKILDKETEAIERINLKQSHEDETEPGKSSPGNSLPVPENSVLPEAPREDVGHKGELGSDKDTLSEEMLRLDTHLPMMLELVELQRKRCREHKAVTLILEMAVNAVETAVQGHDSLLVSGDFLQRKSSWSSDEESQDNDATPSSLSPRVSGALEEERATKQNVNEADLYGDSINNKEALQRALEKMLENLLNEETKRKNLDLGSGSSDSDVSELETSSGKEIPSDDETGANDDEYETGQGSLSEIETQMDGEAENDSEDENNTSESAVPMIYELPPTIEELLRIETFNMSRLLRDEYVDTIRRGRRKIRRIQDENNAELLAKFQERVELLLEGIEFGEIGEERGEKDHSQKRQMLSATPSHDSGIERDLDTDKDDVVRKYKELLEKARMNLNQAHRALKERPRKMDGDEINNEIVEMKRNMKEKENDLKELKEKYSALENERKTLLGKIKKMDPSPSRTELPGEENGEAMKLEHVTHDDLLSSERQSAVNEVERTLAPGAGDDSEINPASTGTGVQQKSEDENDMDSGDSAEKSLGIKAESYWIEGEREVLSKENEALKEKVDALEKEIESKEMEFVVENREKQEEVNELQKKLLDGTGGADIIGDLQERLSEAREEGKSLKTRCSELEKGKELGRSYKEDDPNRARELERFKTENETLEKENKLKQEKINDLQVKLLSGTDGEQILKDLQQDMNELSEKNKILENCQEKEKRLLEKEPLSEDHMAETVARLKREHDALGLENQEVSAKIEKLQKDLLEGTGSEKLLQELQNEMKDLRETNKELEKKCRNIEENKIASADSGDKVLGQKELNQMNKEKEKLTLDNKSKEEEIGELQKKLLEGSGGEELLENLQEQMRELKEKEEGLEKHCQELEDTCEELKNEKEYDRILEKELSDTREENVGLLKENKSKDGEVRELQNALVKGSGGDEMLQKLHDKIKEAEVNNKLLEKQCNDLKNSSEELEKKENESTEEKRKLAKEVEQIKKENDYLERESQGKGDEISKLQEKLLDGTGGEEILREIRDQVKELEEKNNVLRKKCNEMENRGEMLNEEVQVNNENEKELGRLKNQNESLLQDSKNKEREISELQKKLLEGCGGEDILENIQNQSKELMEKNEQLEADCYKLEDENKRLREDKGAMDKETNEITRVMDENSNLADENKTKDDEIRELQRKLVLGTGGEEILEKLQDKIKEAEVNNKALGKECRDLKNASDGLRKKDNALASENRKLAKEVEQIKNENDYLERESLEKSDEVSKLQEKLLNRTGGEEILPRLRDRVKELEEKNKELRKKCNKIEDREEMLNEEGQVNKENEKELGGLKNQNERLLQDSKSKEREISELQKKLLEGSGGEDILQNIQNQLKELIEKNEQLEADSYKLEDENERLIEDKSAMDDQVKELEAKNKELKKKCNEMEDREEMLNDDDEGQINKENKEELAEIKNKMKRIALENKEKDGEIVELQKKLLDGSGADDILEKLQKQIKNLKKENEDRSLKEGGDEQLDKMDDISRLGEENKKLAVENETKACAISYLQTKLVSGTGGEDILRQLQGDLKIAKEKNDELEKKCKDMETSQKGLINKDGEKKKTDVSGHGSNPEKSKEVNGMQKSSRKRTRRDEIVPEERLKGDEDANVLLDEGTDYSKNMDETVTGIGSKEQSARQLDKLRSENKMLLLENKERAEEISELQQKLFEGTGQADTLEKLQDEIKQLREKGETLKSDCHDLEDENEKLRNDRRSLQGELNETPKLRKEKAVLVAENEDKYNEVCELQRRLIEGTGVEELVQQLQDDLKNLKEKNKELEKQCDNTSKLRKKDEQTLKREIAQMEYTNEQLETENEAKSEEINRLQKKLVEGNGSEDILGELQDQVKELEKENKELERMQHDLQTSGETTETVQREGEAERMRELDKLRNIVDKLENEKKDQSDEIIDLQKTLVSGSGGEEMLEVLQEQLKNSKEQNNNLQALCQEFEDIIEKTSSEDIGKQKGGRERSRTMNYPKKVRETTKLRKNVGILEQEKKSADGMGTEAILEQLQERLEDSEGKVKALEIKYSNLDEARNDLMKENQELLKTRDKARRSYDNVKNKRRSSEGVVDKKGTKTPPRKMKESTVLSPETSGEQYASMGGDKTRDKQEFSVVEKSSKRDTGQIGSEQLPVVPPSYDDCIEMIPKITEEKDHWKEKYKSLRKKVGEQFVDIIPEVRAEEAKLEKERNDMLSHVLELSKEISERESPLLETMAENERVERELRKVESQLEENTEQLEYIRDLEDQEERIKEEQSKLRQCLLDIESMFADNDDLQEKGIAKQGGDDDNNEEIYSDEEESREGLHDLYEEVKNILANTANTNVEHKQKQQNSSQEAKIQKEILNLEKAIEELLQGSSAGAIASKSSRSARRSLGNSGDELEMISRDVSELQSSLEESSTSNSREVSNLVGLIKEKSRVEDELSEANKALDKLGKRDLDNLIKERAKQEKVAKRLMEISREQEGFDNEFQRMEASVKSKEAELLSYFKSEKEIGKQVSKRKSGSIEEETVEEKYSKEEEETLEAPAEKQQQLSREDAILMSEELGSMIQKKSSLAVRLDSLGKEITAQSLKVEKSLVGVKEDAEGELNSGSSLDDLSQSQLSIFDDHNMVDELSLATGIVREERVRRKLSRKAPMSKLLKEKAGLDKKHKELESKIVVQNTKFRNALREAKDTDQAQEKFVRFVEEREQIENELETVVSKIDECKNQGDEFASKGKLGSKRRGSSGSLGIRRKSQDKTGGKSLSKNDKRTLLSQRESLVKQLDDVKRRIEDFNLEVDGDGFEVLPEMAEVGNVGKTVEKHRELIIQEAELNRNLEGATKNVEKSDEDKLNEGGVSYRGVLDVLRKEKENKEDILAKLKVDVERVERFNGVGKDDKYLQKKMNVLKGKIENAHRELEIEKQNLKEEFLCVSEGKACADKDVLKDNITGLTKKKEQFEKELVDLQESLRMDTAKSGQDSQQVLKDYEEFARLKKKEESSGEALEEINKKLLTREQWATFGDEEQIPERQGEDNRNNLAHSYGDILKMMDDENLNMADLIRELEVTQETLSREREITGELLDLIKSRVGNELLEALTGDGLLSPLLETAEMNTAGSGEYQEVANKIEHDSVTVAEIITDYKKMNELAQNENQKIFGMLELLKSKIDEDLFAAIIDEEPTDLDDSKKFDVSKILENNETLFQQIVAEGNRNESHEKRVKFLNEQNEKLKMELEDAKDENEEHKQTKNKLENMKKEVGRITARLEDVEIQKEEQLERRSEDLKELEKECASSKEMLANLEKENEAISVKFEDARNKQEETKSELKFANEEKYRLIKETEQRIIELTSKVDETERTKKEMLANLEKENEAISARFEDARNKREETKSELKFAKEEKYRLIKETEQRITELTSKVDETERTKKEMLANLEKENEAISARFEDARNKQEETKSKLKFAKEEKYRLINETERTKKEMVVELKTLQVVKESLEVKVIKQSQVELQYHQSRSSESNIMEEKSALLKKENCELLSRLEEADKMNQGMRNELKLNEQIEENNKLMREKIDVLRKQNEEVVCELNKEKDANKEIAEELKCLGDLKEENVSMKEKMDMLQKQNEEVACDLNKEKETNKEIVEELGDLKQENVSMKEMLEVLEKKNNEIILSLEALKRVNKALEDEVECLRKETEDLESMRDAWNKMEQNEVRLKQELEGLKNEKSKLDDYIAKLLERDISGGLEKALADYTKEFKVTKEEQKSLARECESLKELQQIIGANLAEKLLSLSKEQVVEDTPYIPRSLKSISTGRITLAKVLENYEKDLDTIEKRLGNELFGYVLDKDQASEKTKEEKPLKMSSEFKARGKDLTEIVKAYEDLIDAQASEIKLSEGLSQKVETMETELANLRQEKYEMGIGLDGFCSDDNVDVGVSTTAEEMRVENELVNNNDDMKHLVNAEHVSVKSKQDGLKGRRESRNGGEKERGLQGNNEDEGRLFEHHDLEPLDMESEYQELLRKVIEHQQEIEQAEEMLQEQRKQHEVEKQQLVGRLNNEKNSMLHQIECERNSMEKAMQNLINEIVRLKEERKEIRKNNRMEREKMELSFEKERIELYSKNEMAKTDTKEKLEKTFLEFSQKEKGMMEEKENELKEEVLKLKNERKEMVVKLREMEHGLNDGRLSEERNSDHFQDMREKEEEERREKIRNEFEEKLRKEKKTFQETLVSLRQEIDTLQQERSRALGCISQNDTHASDAVEATEYTISRQGIYEKMESHFKAKVHSEKTSLENRIKELRKEREELHEQKMEMKASMRSQRFEMGKKYEKEKEELSEKYRNEMKELRNKLHEKSEQNQTEANAIAKSFSDYQNFYELQLSLREKDNKIRRYEAFFKELNQEASVFQQDPNIAKLV